MGRAEANPAGWHQPRRLHRNLTFRPVSPDPSHATQNPPTAPLDLPEHVIFKSEQTVPLGLGVPGWRDGLATGKGASNGILSL